MGKMKQICNYIKAIRNKKQPCCQGYNKFYLIFKYAKGKPQIPYLYNKKSHLLLYRWD